jgi:hypothetical protein
VEGRPYYGRPVTSPKRLAAHITQVTENDFKHVVPLVALDYENRRKNKLKARDVSSFGGQSKGIESWMRDIQDLDIFEPGYGLNDSVEPSPGCTRVVSP